MMKQISLPIRKYLKSFTSQKKLGKPSSNSVFQLICATADLCIYYIPDNLLSTTEA